MSLEHLLFQNTLANVKLCTAVLEDGQPLSKNEYDAAKELIRQCEHALSKAPEPVMQETGKQGFVVTMETDRQVDTDNIRIIVTITTRDGERVVAKGDANKNIIHNAIHFDSDFEEELSALFEEEYYPIQELLEEGASNIELTFKA